MYRTVFKEDVKYMLAFFALNNKDLSIIVQIFLENKLDTFGSYINSFRMQKMSCTAQDKKFIAMV